MCVCVYICICICIVLQNVYKLIIKQRQFVSPINNKNLYRQNITRINKNTSTKGNYSIFLSNSNDPSSQFIFVNVPWR